MAILRRLLRAVAFATLVWAAVVTVAFVWWGLVGLTLGRTPVDLLGTREMYRQAVKEGRVSAVEADRIVSEAEREFLRWAVRTAARPILTSSIAIPGLTLLFLRHPSAWFGALILGLAVALLLPALVPSSAGAASSRLAPSALAWRFASRWRLSSL